MLGATPFFNPGMRGLSDVTMTWRQPLSCLARRHFNPGMGGALRCDYDVETTLSCLARRHFNPGMGGLSDVTMTWRQPFHAWHDATLTQA